MFGNVIFEMVSEEKPYSALTPDQAAEKIKRFETAPFPPNVTVISGNSSAINQHSQPNNHLLLPNNNNNTNLVCPAGLKKLMQDCWDPKPERRPSFDKVVDVLDAISKSLGFNTTSSSSSSSSSLYSSNNTHNTHGYSSCNYSSFSPPQSLSPPPTHAITTTPNINSHLGSLYNFASTFKITSWICLLNLTSKQK